LQLDHVVIAVADLAAAAEEIEARHGLGSVDGGRHPGWGTANRIVPLGETYLELVAVVDAAEAARSPFGSWVAGARSGLAPLGWAVRTRELDAVARRLGLTIASGSRAAAGGRLLRWRVAGIERSAAEPSLPFFIEWGHETPFPGHAAAAHGAGSPRIAQLRLTGDADRVAAWLGAHDLPIVVGAGTPAVASVVLTGAAGEIAG